MTQNVVINAIMDFLLLLLAGGHAALYHTQSMIDGVQQICFCPEAFGQTVGTSMKDSGSIISHQRR